VVCIQKRRNLFAVWKCNFLFPRVITLLIFYQVNFCFANGINFTISIQLVVYSSKYECSSFLRYILFSVVTLSRTLLPDQLTKDDFRLITLHWLILIDIQNFDILHYLIKKKKNTMYSKIISLFQMRPHNSAQNVVFNTLIVVSWNVSPCLVPLHLIA
jgi:hypothetical protein